MNFSKKVRSNSGFTLSEILVVVAIIIILLGISIPALYNAAINYKMTELNATARQIFIATQNNLTNLQVRGIDDTIDGLGTDWVDSNTGRKGTYMNNNSADIKLILPENSIDKVVADNGYTILYNSNSNTVIEVFYGETSFDSENALNNLSGGDPSVISARRDARIGYYSGDDLKNAPTLKLDSPTISVTNDDRLTVNISAMDILGSGKDTRLVVTVEDATDPQKSVDFFEGTDFNGRQVGNPTNATFILDSLFPGENKFGTLVGNRVSDFPFSEQINIFVRIEYIGSTHVAIPEYSNVVESNGLYESKENDVAKIGYPRHLQNLDSNRNPTNGAAPFTAVQTKLINWYNENSATPVSFDPINPKGLIKGYDGSDLIIRDIWIDKTTPENTEKSAGLFGELEGTNTQKITISNVRLINPSMEAQNFTTVGSLIGKSSHVNINSTYVYILNYADGKAHERYKLIGKDIVGGMIGEASNTNISNSFSGLAYAQGNGSTPTVGGLIGTVNNNSGKSIITNSYAVIDEIIAYNGTAAMFVANNKSGNNLQVVNSYAVGNIQGELSNTGNITKKPNTVNGFFDTGSATNSYCAVSYLTSDGDKLGLKDIGGFSTSGNLNNALYLNPIGATSKAGNPGTVQSYGALSKLPANTPSSSFVGLSLFQSNPYREELINANPKEAYPFKGLKSTDNKIMPHYGSWPVALDQNPQLVYYEEYSDKTYGLFYYSIDDQLVDTLKGNSVSIIKAGYGMLTPADQDVTNLKIEYKDNTNKYIALTNPFESEIKISSNGIDYDLRALKSNTEKTITDAITAGLAEEYSHTAIRIGTDVEPELIQRNIHTGLGASIALPKAILGTNANPYQVRTSSQLKNIDIPADTNVHYIFMQTHNIDAQSPAGQLWTSKVFTDRTITSPYKTSSTDTKEINTISNLNAPLFETIIGSKSKVEGLNVVESKISITDTSKSAGIFANRITSGTINRCTVKDSSIISKVQQYINTGNAGYVAGFASYSGVNDSGTLVSNCDVINVYVESTNKATATGFIANNGGKIERCQVYSQDTSSNPLGPGSYNKVTIISNGFAAGFTANLTNSSNISYCSVTGNVKGTWQALGFVQQPGNSKIINSYANCNVEGGTACGFTKDAPNAIIENCYVMLNVTGTSIACGFAESVNSNVKNCFTTATINNNNWNEAYGFAKRGIPTNSYYIGQNFTGNQIGIASSVDEMITPEFVAKLKSSDWTYDKNLKPSYPYAKILQKKTNPFPMIKNFPHHGDWLIVPEVPAGLVYYETYKGLNQEMPLYNPDGTPQVDKDGKPITEIRPIYYVYGIDSSGLTTSNLKGNQYTITDAGYGILLPTGAIDQTVQIRYGDGGTNTVNINQTLKDPLQTGVAVQTLGGNVHILKRFTRESTITLGKTISQFDEHLSVPIEITHGANKQTYDIAPFSAQGVAPLDLNNLGDRVLFGTDQKLEYIDADGNSIEDIAHAKVRTPKQLDDVDRYMGFDSKKISPTRYFLQTHDIAMINPDAKEGVKRDQQDLTENVILGANESVKSEKAIDFNNAVYDGDNNTIFDSDQSFIEVLFGTGIVKNVVMDKAKISNKNNGGILVNQLIGTIENCQVINSSITNNERVEGVGGLVGRATKGDAVLGNGSLISYFPTISNSKVVNTSITTTHTRNVSATAAGFVNQNAANITNCYVEDVVLKGQNVAGFVAINSGMPNRPSVGKITNSYVDTITATSTGQYTMGGTNPVAAGFAYENKATIENCYTKDTIVTGYEASGFAHVNGSLITLSYNNNATVTGSIATGFVGKSEKSEIKDPSTGVTDTVIGITDSCYTTGTIYGSGNGNNKYNPVMINGFAYITANSGETKITNCYTTMTLDGRNAKGYTHLNGFLGGVVEAWKPNKGLIENCYSATKMYYNNTSGQISLAGFARRDSDIQNTITNSYYLDTFNTGVITPKLSYGTAQKYSQMNITGMKFPTSIWIDGPSGNSYPTSPTLISKYPFPIIKALGSHYGNWPIN